MNISKNILIEIYPFKELPLQLTFEEKVINLAIKSATQQQQNFLNNESNEYNCLFTASALIEADTNKLSLVIDGFDPGKSAFNCNKQSLLTNGFNIIPTATLSQSGCIYVPVRVINYNITQNNNKNMLESGMNSNINNTHNQNFMSLYANSVNLLATYCTTNCITIDSISNFISIFSTINYKTQSNTISADLYFDIISLTNRFFAQPTPAIPILTTALSKALNSAANNTLYSVPKTGYCSIYQNEKILLVLESDPKANTLPLVGIWVSGISKIDHPLIWAACIRYKFSPSILKRINDEDESFIIVIFPSTHKKPEFYKCTTTQSTLDFTLFSGQEKLITTKNLSNMIMNKASTHHIDDHLIIVNLMEVKEGFKLKSFMNAISELCKFNGNESNENNNKDKKLNEIEYNIETPLKQQPEFQLQTYETINRSQCVSDLSILSDDGINQQQQLQKIYYDNDNFKPFIQKQYENQIDLTGQMIQRQNQQKLGINNNNTHSMLFGIPRNPPLPIGFPAQPLAITNEFINESKILDTNNEIMMPPPLIQQQQQQQQNNRHELKSSLKKSPPQLNGNMTPLVTKQLSQPIAKELFNSYEKNIEEANNFHYIQQQTPQNQMQPQMIDQLNYQQIPQLKKQISFPKFTQTEPIKKNDSSTSITLTQQQQQQQQQYNPRMSNEFFNNQPPQSIVMNDASSINNNPVVQTQIGLLTQQDVCNYIFRTEELVKNLSEQVRRLEQQVQQMQHQQQQHFNNTMMTDNSNKNSESSSNEQRSMSSLKSHIGNENEFLNNTGNNNNNNNNNRMVHSTSISSNMGGSINLTTNSAEMKQQQQVVQNINNSNFNFNNVEENTTVYRSIENEREKNNDSPIMLFDQSSAINNNSKNKSDESKSSWKSTSVKSNDIINNEIKTNTNNSNKESDKRIGCYNNTLDDENNDNVSNDDDDDDDDDDDSENDFIALKQNQKKFINNDESLINDFNNSLKTNNYNNNQYMSNNVNSYMFDSSGLPKVQYISMYIDDNADKNLSLEVNALAMKYLKDDQLTKVAKLQSKRSNNKNGGKYNQEYIDENDFSTICESNNLSLASKQYFEKYGISYNNSNKKKNLKQQQQQKPQFDRSLSTPVPINNKNGMTNKLNNNHKQLLSENDIKNNTNNNNNNNNNNKNNNNHHDEEEIWLFSNPKSKSPLKKKTSPSNNRQFENNNGDTYKFFDNEEEDTSNILDVENLKKLPKLL